MNNIKRVLVLNHVLLMLFIQFYPLGLFLFWHVILLVKLILFINMAISLSLKLHNTSQNGYKLYLRSLQKVVRLLNLLLSLSFPDMMFLLNCSWIMVLPLKVIKLNNFLINITLKENYLHLIILKAMVKQKHLIRSLRVHYQKLL